MLLVMLLLVLSLSSCKSKVAAGDKPLDTLAAAKQLQSGTQGIELKFFPNSPPPYIYDRNELIVLVEVQNKGAYDVLPEDCFIQISGHDPGIITGGLDFPRSCAENLPYLEGKNIYNLEGGLNQIEFKSSNIVLNDVQEYKPPLRFSTCYHYKTKATPSVCIDPLFYQVSSEQKACNFRQSVSTGGGQGGPVGIGYVGVAVTGDGRVTFDINVRNMGSGQILSPFADIRACSSSFDRTETNQVGYTVRLGSSGIGDCKPQGGLVPINPSTGQGKILCDFYVPGAVAYETPLTIDLHYGYIQSYMKQISIIKTPGS